MSGLDRGTLATQLRALRVPPDGDVLVHCSVRRIGPMTGGPATLLAALRDALGAGATLVAPAQTTNNSTTGPAFRQATREMSAAQIAEFEAAMPGFDRDSTPSFAMGALAEHLRRHPGAIRSAHPQSSFAALGPRAQALMAVHDLECHLGNRSPLAALYDSDAWVLLLGVGYDVCTGLHLAEYRLPWAPPTRGYRCFMLVDGVRVRADFVAADLDRGDFERLGAAMDREPFVNSGPIGNASAKVFPLRNAVDFAIGWLVDHRGP